MEDVIETLNKNLAAFEKLTKSLTLRPHTNLIKLALPLMPKPVPEVMVVHPTSRLAP